MQTIIEIEFNEHLKVSKAMRSIYTQIELAANLCIDSLQSGGKK